MDDKWCSIGVRMKCSTHSNITLDTNFILDPIVALYVSLVASVNILILALHYKIHNKEALICSTRTTTLYNQKPSV